MLTTLGNDSLLHRVQHFQTPQLRESALEAAEKLIDNHNVDSIKSKSPAAGTFYVWVGCYFKVTAFFKCSQGVTVLQSLE